MLTDEQRAEVERIATAQQITEYDAGKLAAWRYAAGRGTDDRRAIDRALARVDRKPDA